MDRKDQNRQRPKAAELTGRFEAHARTTRKPRSPERVTHAVSGGACDFRDDMRVRAEREADLGVAEDFHHDACGHPLREQQCRRGVTCIVQASWRNASA